MYEEDIPSVENLNQALVRTALGTPSIPKQTEISNKISATRTSIVPLNIIHPLLCYPFLYPTSA